MSTSTNSTVSNLRLYRIKKNNTASSNVEQETGTGWTDLELVPGRKRIHTAVDSSSDEAMSPVKPTTEKQFKADSIEMPASASKVPTNSTSMSVKEKEFQLVALKKLEPEYDAMICQDALVRSNWDAKAAALYLREHYGDLRKLNRNIKQIPKSEIDSEQINGNKPFTVSNSSHQASDQNGHSVSTPWSSAKKKARRRQSESEESDNDNNAKPKEKVFDSDEEDSDTEMVYEMTKDRRGVLDFMNNATANEMQMVKTGTLKKVEAIMELRPFENWSDLIRKLQMQKNLSTDLLNYSQDFLIRRNNMVKIMSKCDKLVRKLEAAFADKKSTLEEQPFILNPQLNLADYQMSGLNWLAIMHKEGMNGILADEMGLGKTIQVIAFLAYLKETGQSNGTHLIVVPSSTLDNWMLELTKWCPDLIVEKYYGSAEERRALRIQYAKSIAGIDVILTTYHMVQSTPEERKMFRVTRMQYVIFDEAHMLKNMTTQRYAYLFRINAERRLLLTGTPLQNNLLELMSLLCFVMPSIFANSTEDIKNLFSKNNKIKDEEDISTFEQTQIDRAKKIMKPFILRRLKNDVLNSLPSKSDVVLKPAMSERQKKLYKELVYRYSNDEGVVQGTADVPVMSIMMDMRKLANHPLLLRYYYTDDKVREIAKILSTHPLYKKNPNPQYIFEELAILSDFQLLQIMERYNIEYKMPIPDKLILDSGKFKKLDELLPKLKSEGHRVLIFSQFTMMLDILERYLDLRNHTFLRIDGQTAVIDRQNLIDEYFKDEDIFVFLLSTRAGGLGINLTAADTAIIHDIDFNPYNDKQAEDRCHRMGQTKPVTIYRFVSEGTLEEGMSMLAHEKLTLEKEVTGEGDLKKDYKGLVRLLSMALGLDEAKAEIFLSPQKNANRSANQLGDDVDF